MSRGKQGLAIGKETLEFTCRAYSSSNKCCLWNHSNGWQVDKLLYLGIEARKFVAETHLEFV